MALSKIQSESINLADTFAFTGTVSGAGSEGLVHLETQEVTSAVTGLKFGSDVFNTTYNRYVVKGRILPTADGNDLRFRFIDSSEADITTSSHFRRTINNGSTTLTNHFPLVRAIGAATSNETGTFFHIDIWLPHVGNSDYQSMVYSRGMRVNNGQVPSEEMATGVLRYDIVSTQPEGIHLYMSSNNIDKANVSVFGVSKG
tara:strand:- start:27 stop:629 length:603 start_codon:yes stop_codon:yes gene_type:complete